MSPVTHLLISWSVASCFKIDKKDRILGTLAGVISDIDGIGIGYDLLIKFQTSKCGLPPLEIVSSKANRAFADTVQKRFPYSSTTISRSLHHGPD